MEAGTMGQYGAYIWSSYGLALIVLVICTYQARRRLQKVLQEISRRLRTMEPDK